MEYYVVIERDEGNRFFTYAKWSELGLRKLFYEIWALARPDWTYDETGSMQSILDTFNEHGICDDARVIKEQDFRAYCAENKLVPTEKWAEDFDAGVYVGMELIQENLQHGGGG